MPNAPLSSEVENPALAVDPDGGIEQFVGEFLGANLRLGDLNKNRKRDLANTLRTMWYTGLDTTIQPAGGTQGAATLISREIVMVTNNTAFASSAGLRLPDPALTGQFVAEVGFYDGNGTASYELYPAVGQYIMGLAINLSTTIPEDSWWRFRFDTATLAWILTDTGNYN